MQDVINTFVMPLNLQVEIGCRILQSKPELRNGYNAVGISQESLLMYEIINIQYVTTVSKLFSFLLTKN